MQALVKLENVDPQAILSRYIGEETTKDIAASLGVSRPALTNWLIKKGEDEWRDAQIVRAIERKERATDDIDEIADKLRKGVEQTQVPALMALHKVAESQLKSAQWDLERTYRKLYGQYEPPAITTPVQINIGIFPQPPAIEGKQCASAASD